MKKEMKRCRLNFKPAGKEVINAVEKDSSKRKNTEKLRLEDFPSYSSNVFLKNNPGTFLSFEHAELIWLRE